MNAQALSSPAFPSRWVLAATAFCAVFLGVLWWSNGGFFDSDEAVVGLMARHILYRGELPVFYWGQEYMGAVEAYLAVPLFAIFGPTVRTLKLVPVAFTVATVPIAAGIAFRAAGRWASILTAFIFATPPLAFTLWSIKTRGGFTEPVELGLWIFWGTFKIIEARTERHRLTWAAACGFALGLGLWWGEFVVPFALGALVVLVVHPRARTARVWGVGVLAAVVGAGPAIWRNAFTTHWATVTHALVPDPLQASVQHQPMHAVPAIAWHNLQTIGIPAMIGFHDARIAPFDPHGPLGSVAAVLVALTLGGALAALMWLVKVGALEQRLATVGPLLGGAAMIGLYVYSRFGFEREPRYVLALWPAFAFCIGWTAWSFTRFRRVQFLGPLVCAFVLGFQVQRVYFSEPLDKLVLWNPGAPITKSFVSLSDKLVDMGKTHILADYWTALRLSFDSGERVLAVDPGGDRQPNTKEVLQDPRSCWLSTRGNQADQAARQPGWTRVEFGREVEGLGEPQVLACPP